MDLSSDIVTVEWHNSFMNEGATKMTVINPLSKHLIIWLTLCVVSTVFLTAAVTADTITVRSDTSVEWSTSSSGPWNQAKELYPIAWPLIDSSVPYIWISEWNGGLDQCWECNNEPFGDGMYGYYFRKTVNIPAGATNIQAKYSIDADNAYALFVNGGSIIKDGSLSARWAADCNFPADVGCYAWHSIETGSINTLHPGENTILVRARNYYRGFETDPLSGNMVQNVCPYVPWNIGNPTGVTFRIDITFDQNTPPEVEAGADQMVNEGDLVAFSGSFSDLNPSDTHTIVWTFGDGTSASGLLIPSPHAYADDGIYTVTLTVTDDNGGATSDTLTVTVKNVAPLVEAGPDQTVNAGDGVSFSGWFSDAGAADTHSILWTFGDGASASGLLIPTPHVYADDGIYTVTLTVTDDDGGATPDTLTVTVRDPSQGGGITVPEFPLMGIPVVLSIGLLVVVILSRKGKPGQ